MLRIISTRRRGSSRPIVVESDRGPLLVKLRGAAQGVAPLVAECIVGALAASLDLPVLPRIPVLLTGDEPVADADDEMHDLLRASVGLNLGAPFLTDAVDVRTTDAIALGADFCARVLWLDRLVQNVDRTARNPNLLRAGTRVWLIDHGSALPFHFAWDRVHEDAPRAYAPPRIAHLFDARVSRGKLAHVDALLGPRLTRAALAAAVATVPEALLAPLVRDVLVARDADRADVEPTDEALADAIARRRAAYIAWLWKRLQAPRAFATGEPALSQTSAAGR